MEDKKLNPIEQLGREIEKIKNKEFNVYFFVADTKGAPSGYISYIYETALSLKGMGYNVHMLHQENEYVGLSSWAGDRYDVLPHHNIEKENISLSASDFLLIPELFSNVMEKTIKVPCKRVVILQNYDFMTKVIPAGATWSDYGIRDCVCTTKRLHEIVTTAFPHMNARIVTPVVDNEVFENVIKSKQLVVNIVAKDEADVNKIVKPFFWKFPMYKWVAFRDLRGLTKEEFLTALNESAITVWVDKDTEFGYSAVEAIKCKNLVIGCVPNNAPEWMVDESGDFTNRGIWYYDENDVHALIAGAIESFLKDSLHESITDGIDSTASLYTHTEFNDNIKKIYVDDIFDKHRLALTIALNALENNNLEK